MHPSMSRTMVSIPNMHYMERSLLDLLSLERSVDHLAAPPKNWAVTLFPSFDSIDVVGVLNPLW